MKDYTCPNEVRKGVEIMCKQTNDYCGHVKYCRMAGRWKMTEQSVDCPIRKKGEKDD